jgi:hypothetical protein
MIEVWLPPPPIRLQDQRHSELLCILHTLLRLVAVVFKRTITANCDTQAKVDALNTFIKEAHLGCKKMKLKEKDARKTKDTEDINFIGR